MSCQICINSFTKRDRKKVTCPSCDYVSCATCVQTYLTTTIETPHCMSCRKSFSRKFMIDMCGKSYMTNEYKKHRENVLFNFEKALCPSTQDDVKIFVTRRELSKELGTTTVMLSMMRRDLDHAIFTTRTIEDVTNRNFLRLQIARLESSIDVINFKLNNPDHTNDDRKEFIRGCPAPDCKGFLSKSLVCGLCDIRACAKCHEVKMSEDHQCDPNSVETVKMLARDSKPCPKCASVIYKIGGCDQMYCVQCNTAFSWKTGKLCSGVIHNPHYFDYMRTRNLDTRNVLDVGCGGLPHIWDVQVATGRYKRCADILRSALHFMDIEMHRYNVNLTNPNRNLNLRILWMVNDLSDIEFKKKLQQADKDLNKRLEIGQVMSTFIQVLSDTFNTMIANADRDHLAVCQKFDVTYDEISVYFNKILQDISSTYDCSVPWIGLYGIKHLMSRNELKTMKV